MKRTKLIDRLLPKYTNGEEIFNMVSHIVGGALGIVSLTLCVIFAALNKNVFGVVSGAIYGSSLIVLYTMSSLYHGLSSKTMSNFFSYITVVAKINEEKPFSFGVIRNQPDIKINTFTLTIPILSIKNELKEEKKSHSNFSFTGIPNVKNWEWSTRTKNIANIRNNSKFDSLRFISDITN